MDRDISTCIALQKNSTVLTYAYQSNTTALKQQVQEYHIALHLQDVGSCTEFTAFTFHGHGVCDQAALCEPLSNNTVSTLCHFNCTCTSDICSYGIIELEQYSVSVCEMYFIVDK